MPVQVGVLKTQEPHAELLQHLAGVRHHVVVAVDQHGFGAAAALHADFHQRGSEIASCSVAGRCCVPPLAYRPSPGNACWVTLRFAFGARPRWSGGVGANEPPRAVDTGADTAGSLAAFGWPIDAPIAGHDARTARQDGPQRELGAVPTSVTPLSARGPFQCLEATRSAGEAPTAGLGAGPATGEQGSGRPACRVCRALVAA